jgi:hypothetical protein
MFELPHPTPRATARVPSPHQPNPCPYKDTLLLIGSSYLCKGGSGVEWSGDPCGRPRGGVGVLHRLPRLDRPTGSLALLAMVALLTPSYSPSDCLSSTCKVTATPRHPEGPHPASTQPPPLQRPPRHPKETARVPAPKPRGRPQGSHPRINTTPALTKIRRYSSTPRSLCKGGGCVERSGDPCGRPRGGVGSYCHALHAPSPRSPSGWPGV